MIRLLLALLVLIAPGGAAAADRRFTVTDYDRLVVEGPFIVSVVTGKPPSATASGAPAALDRLRLSVEGRTLRVRAERSSGRPLGPVAIALSAHDLRAIQVAGAAQVSATRLKAMRLELGLAGSGSLKAEGIDADRLTAGLVGSGSMLLSGRTKVLQANVQGAAGLDAAALAAEDAELQSESAGDVRLQVRRSAKGNVRGSGNTFVEGSPACTIESGGAGSLSCGD